MRKAEQGSIQIQGEVLENEMENLLLNEFPADTINGIKKGVRGADVKQIVKNKRLEDCGIMLWESKNAMWSNDWIAKLKNDMLDAGAAIGILVAKNMPKEFGEIHNLGSNIWVVRPNLALALGTALRSTILQVYTANHNSVNKDAKMERIYQYLTGAEFANRIRVIISNYRILQDEIEKEKRSANLRWGRQEKAIRGVIDNAHSFYGDLQGLTGSDLQKFLLIETETAETAA
ncbi:MAG: DUF2130 domain-containing protein [Oscillospiraceae bacterium]|nr:DUF2130 domain-containing protein [Oscillospiraceae bacterium]